MSKLGFWNRALNTAGFEYILEGASTSEKLKGWKTKFGAGSIVDIKTDV